MPLIYVAGLSGAGKLPAVKADHERKLRRVVLDCVACGRTVLYVGGLGARAGHCAHAEPAPHENMEIAHG
jgi:hypothetical protein